MKTPNKREIIGKFAEQYSKKFIKTPDITQLITNLIMDGITDPERLRNYMIVNEYPENLRKNDGHVSLTNIQLSEKYDLSERQIQNIVYKWRQKYRQVNNVSE